MKNVRATREKFDEYFKICKEKGFHEELMTYCASGNKDSVWVMVWEGKNVVESAKIIVGYTSPMALNGHFCVYKASHKNLCHCSEDIYKANSDM